MIVTILRILILVIVMIITIIIIIIITTIIVLLLIILRRNGFPSGIIRQTWSFDMRGLLGWLETRLAQNTLNDLNICLHTLKKD